MSNFLAVATVSAALRRLLGPVAGAAVPGATVTTFRPDNRAIPTNAVNLFAYQVMPNGAFRGSDLPTRTGSGSLVERPHVGLDISYLISFYGNDSDLEPQRLLGAVVRSLHSQPILTRETIRSTVAATPFLATSDLADSVELVKLTPLGLSLDEISKLWTMFFETSYALSVAYQASVVIIHADERAPEPVPVGVRQIRVLASPGPLIDLVEPDRAAVGSTLAIQGSNLAGDSTTVRFGTVEETPATLTAKKLTVVVPASLRAGPQGVRVINRINFGTPADPHTGTQSNVVPFLVIPTITTLPPFTAARGTNLVLSVSPAVGRTQDAALIIGQRAIEIPDRPTPGPETTTSLTFPIAADFPTGSFLMRLRIDGAESAPLTDSQGAYIGPMVTIT